MGRNFKPVAWSSSSASTNQDRVISLPFTTNKRNRWTALNRLPLLKRPVDDECESDYSASELFQRKSK